MADALQKLTLQHAHATNALNFGKLGTATYVERSSDWSFLREETGIATHAQGHAAAAFPFRLVGLEAHTSQPKDTGTTLDLAAEDQSVPIRNVLQLVPEAFCEVSRGQQKGGTDAQSYGYSAGPTLRPTQLAFGGAAAVLNHGTTRQTIPIVAIASGRNLEAVRLLLIGKEAAQTTDTHGTYHSYQLPRISYDEEGYWTSEGGPVQQVCFAAACDFETTQSAWMAARCYSATTIFHPLFHRTQIMFDTTASRLDPNPILKISIFRTGGHPHADVAFHPQDHKVLAIVDVRGNWSVWKIEVPRRSVTSRALFGIHLESAGRLFTDMRHSPLQGDWHRICWISRTPHESDRLLVSSRSYAALFDRVGDNLGVVDLRKGSTDDVQMVLDVAKSTTNPTHCYILTSTKLLLLSAAETDRAGSTGHEQLAMLLSWSHYRDRGDLSLTLMLAETAQATTILITSDNNSMVTACRTGLILEKSPTPVSLADPAHFDLLNHEKIGQQLDNARMLAFRDLQVQSRGGMSGDGNPVLFKAFLARPSTGLDELLYRCTDDVASSTFEQPHSTAIPLPMLKTLRQKSKKHEDLGDLGSFVVADETTAWIDSMKPGRLLSAEFRLDTETASGVTGTTNWQDTRTMLVDLEGASQAEIRPRELALAIKDLQLELKRREEPQTTIQTLKELLDTRTSLSDFEAAARAFAGFATDAPDIEDQQSRVSQLNIPGGRFPDGSVSDVHDQLKANWILPLSHSIDNKTRLAKDRITRSVTADLALSRVTIGPVPAVMSEAPQTPKQDPGPSDSASSPSSALVSAHEAQGEDPACTRLRQYGPLTKPIPPISQSSLLTDLLAHLPTDISANPSDYSWRDTEARLAAAHSAEKTDPKARRKAERLAASQRKRLEAQKQISQAVEQELAPPMVVSSYVPPVREVQSSQVGPSVQDEEENSVPMPMTQPARGAFGSRVAPTGKGQAARKKSRKQGF